MSDLPLSAAAAVLEPERQIVVIEDDAALLQALRFDLELEGFSVQAHTTPATLRTEDLPADNACLVIDYRLPGLNGLELLRRLRDNHVQLPTILMTTNPNAVVYARAKSLGAVVVEKPLLGDRLIAAINHALTAA